MPSSANTGRDSEKFNLRLPDGMRDRLAEVAKANGRSMNAEIVHRLNQSLGDGELLDGLSPSLRAQAIDLLRALTETSDEVR